jgi:transcriptional regulator with XRE-family HTH domain
MSARLFISLDVATNRLNNYILTERMRAGLSQQELAYLLGFKCGSTVSRCELFDRDVSLETAMALEVIFGVPIRELFAGQYDRVKQKTRRRIDRLGAKLSNRPQDRYTVQKIQTLELALESIRSLEHQLGA